MHISHEYISKLANYWHIFHCKFLESSLNTHLFDLSCADYVIIMCQACVIILNCNLFCYLSTNIHFEALCDVLDSVVFCLAENRL